GCTWRNGTSTSTGTSVSSTPTGTSTTSTIATPMLREIPRANPTRTSTYTSRSFTLTRIIQTSTTAIPTDTVERSARDARARRPPRKPGPGLVFQRRHCLQDFRCPRSVRVLLVLPNSSVLEDQDPPGELRDVVLVRHQDDRQSLVVEILEDLHDLDGRATVEV